MVSLRRSLLGPAMAAVLCLAAATASYGANRSPIYHYAVNLEYSDTFVSRACPFLPEDPAPPPYTVSSSTSGHGEGYIVPALGGGTSFRGSITTAATTSDGVSNEMTFDDVFVATVTTPAASPLDPTPSAPWTVQVRAPFPDQTVSASFGGSFGVSLHREDVGGPLFPCGLEAYRYTASGTATFSLLETLVFSESDGRDRPPSHSGPRADAGGPYTVRRGAGLRLDGSRSRAKSGIASYRWTFGTLARVAAEQQDCRPRKRAEKGGARPKVVVLCDIKAKLTVTDRRGRSGSDTTTIHVRPRKWDPVKFVQRPGVKRLHGGFVYGHGACLSCEWGRNIDTRDVDSDDQTSGYIIRGGRKNEHGYTVDRVDNPNGPFDGDWYVADHELRIDRTALVNGRLFPGGDVYDVAANANKALVQSGKKPLYSVDAVRQSTTDHEHLHARLIGEALRALPDEKDPVKQLERLTRRSRSQLEEDGDKVIGAAANILTDATADVHVKARMPAKWRREALLLLPEGEGNFASYRIPSLADLGDSG